MLSEIMTAKLHEGHFCCILDWANSLHHVHECVLALYLATEHNCSPISFEQFQNTPDLCHGKQPFKKSSFDYIAS